MTPIKGPVHIGAKIPWRILQGEAVEIFRPRHRQGQTETISQPTGEPNMVWMKVRHHHGGKTLPSQWPAQDAVPGVPAGVGAVYWQFRGAI